MPGQFPQVFRPGVAHGAVEEQDVHSLSMPRDGKCVHLRGEVIFLAVELWRGVVKMGPLPRHRVREQRRHCGLRGRTQILTKSGQLSLSVQAVSKRDN